MSHDQPPRQPARVWAATLPARDARSLDPLRAVPEIEVADAENQLWVRGPVTPALEDVLAAIPFLRRYRVDPKTDWLIPRGHLTPEGRLPDLPFQPLEDWLRLRLPPAAFSGQPGRRVPLRLVRVAEAREASLLVTPLATWVDFARRAAQVRLEPLCFAAGSGRAVIRGRPLPPLPGERFVDHEGIGIAAGHHWQPRVQPSVLRQLLRLDDNAIVLWSPWGLSSPIGSGSFVEARRSAARLTLDAVFESPRV